MCDHRLEVDAGTEAVSGQGAVDSHDPYGNAILQQTIRPALESEWDADPADRSSGSASKICLALEAERRRLAEALHDQVLQNLALGGIQLEHALKKGELPDNEAVRNLRRTLQTSILEIRNLCVDLSPPLLNDVGLQAAILSLGERLAGLRGFNFVLDGEAEEPVLREDLKLALFQIARELLFNAAKHSRADRVDLRLFQDGGVVRLYASDNGVGFEEGDSRKGFGLAIMKQRVRDLGGEINLFSAPGAGTTFEITVPSGLPDLEETISAYS